MPSETSNTVEVSAPLRGFDNIPDFELVAEFLDDRTQRDPCPGCFAFIGTARKRSLEGVHAEHLAERGLAPNVYLAIRWWCLFFIPVVPLGAYAVADVSSISRPFSAPHGRAFPVAMDWRAASIQATLGLVAIAITIAAGFRVSGI